MGLEHYFVEVSFGFGLDHDVFEVATVLFRGAAAARFSPGAGGAIGLGDGGGLFVNFGWCLIEEKVADLFSADSFFQKGDHFHRFDHEALFGGDDVAGTNLARGFDLRVVDGDLIVTAGGGGLGPCFVEPYCPEPNVDTDAFFFGDRLDG